MVQIVGVGISIGDFWKKMREIIREELKGNPSMLQQTLNYKEYNTQEAMETLGYKDHRYFKKYLTRNNIAPNRKAHNKKYYLHSDLFKSQTFK